MASRRQAFTLIELLVVVSIIALLLLLISPTIQLITEHRAKVTCLRNLQSQHIAAMQYTNDFNGYLVAVHPKKTAPRTCYSDELQKYLEFNDAVFRCPNVTDLSLDLDSANNKILCYGINVYCRASKTAEAKKQYLSHLSNVLLREVANTDVIVFSDADYDESPENVGGVSTGTWEWPLRYSFQEDSWNRHMGHRDPVLPRPGPGKHDRTQYMDAFEGNAVELRNIWGGYNAISLSGSGVWRRGYPASNRAWLAKKHQSD